MSKIIGIDYGEKRVGLALADLEVKVATPLQTVEIRGRKHFLEVLENLVREHSIKVAVIGLPVNMNGEEGESAQRIRSHVEWLSEKLDLKWEFWDERLTTFEADQSMDSMGLGFEKKKSVRDQIAATRILQTYLDAQ